MYLWRTVYNRNYSRFIITDTFKCKDIALQFLVQDGDIGGS